MGPVVRRFVVVLVKNFRDDIDGLLIVKLRIMVQCLMRRLVGVGVVVVMIVMVVMRMYVIRN
jgi:hypothetical protein